MTHILRPISASEYDAAVRAAPDHCPLFAAGDRRSGQQLLADAAADARQDPRAAWRTGRGARCLDALVARLQASARPAAAPRPAPALLVGRPGGPQRGGGLRGQRAAGGLAPLLVRRSQ